MKPVILALALAFAAAPIVAHAQGEGNGPSFPGLQEPNFGVSTATGPAGHNGTTVTMDHSDSDYYMGPNENVPPARPGLTRAQLARRAHTWQMLDDNTHG